MGGTRRGRLLVAAAALAQLYMTSVLGAPDAPQPQPPGASNATGATNVTAGVQPAGPKVCMVSMTTLNHDYVASEDAQYSFEYALATQTAYAHKWGYPFFLQAVTPPGDEQHDKRLDWGRLYMVQHLQATLPALCEWIFALEGDVIITNHLFNLATVFALAGNASFVINRDAAGNLNTGMWYVRSTPLAQDMLAFIATIRYTHKADSRVRGWGFNGGTMVRGEAGDVRADAMLPCRPSDAPCILHPRLRSTTPPLWPTPRWCPPS